MLHIEIHIRGISVTDPESGNLFSTLIMDRLDDSELPFYLSGLAFVPQMQNDALFLHERLRPLKSENSKLLSKLPKLEIPEEYCCPLSGDIIGTPIYDIRAPQVRYDRDFLILLDWKN